MINIFWDIEADGLYHEWEPEKATRVDCHCALVEDTKRGVEYFLETWNGTREGAKDSKCYVIGHGIFDYDLPMMAKFKGWEYDIFPDRLNGERVEFVDTLILSKLLNPDRVLPKGFAEQWKPEYEGQKMPGPHSLAVWAYRLNMKKPMLVYGDKMGNVPFEVSVAQCKADIEITKALYYHLMAEVKRWNLNLREPLKIEQGVRHIMTQGATEGVWFDSEKAETYIPELDRRMAEIAARVEPQLPMRDLPASKVKLPPKRRFKKDMTPHADAKKYFGKALVEDDGVWVINEPSGESTKLIDWPADKPFGQEIRVHCKIGDQADIKQWLMDEYEWKPTLWNKSKKTGKITTPKFHFQGKLCENLEALGEVVPVVEDIILWLSYRNRRNVICSENGTGWLHHPRLALDHRLPADADTLGTPTMRMTHKVVANIPRPSSTFGEEMRGLFRAPPTKKIAGWDAGQLEDRCKAHYCYNYTGGREYGEKLLDPDYSAHEENMVIWGLPKTKCKSGHFALQYGCRPPKLSETLGVSAEQGELWWEDWWERNLPLKEFVENIETVWMAYDKKFLPGIDGRLIPTRKRHALANSLFQSAGVIVMKWAMVYWWLEIRERNLDAKQIIHYHDEAAAIADEKIIELVKDIGVRSIEKAGRRLGFRVPLVAEGAVGDSWLDIH